MLQADLLDLVGLLFALVLLGWLAVLIAFAAPLRARWREPVFRVPILVLESDDWGAGPLEQSAVLTRIAKVLQGFRDRSGRAPVMTLGMVFEVPDRERMAREGLAEYHGIGLEDACFAALREAIRQGIESRVFVPQLHGQCHYWLPALMAAAARDESVRAWLTSSGLAQTEALPSPLQSRWVDASELPSRALDQQAIEAAAEVEAASFRQMFGHAPGVAVATTFVWNDTVEAAWARVGVSVIITPGRRATCRDAAGHPGCVDRTMLAGERSDVGQTYLVRDVYFEPALGHAPERLVQGLAERTRQGRACLVETHRFNFLQAPDASLEILQKGLAACLDAHPDSRFLSPQEIAQAIERGDAALIERRFLPRLKAWLHRLHEIPMWTRIARLTGLFVPLKLMGLAA